MGTALENVRSFQDGPWVFCSAYQSLNDGEAKWMTTDLFFSDDEGLILEHWDVIAPYVAQTPSGTDMVRGTDEIDETADSTANKSLVLEFTKQVIQGGDLESISNFVSPDIIQHSPNIGAGIQGIETWLRSEASGDYEMLFRHIGQGDFVMTYGKRHAMGKDIAVFDIYRIANSKIVEHWDNAEEISPRDQWGNSGKF